jgi:hypothetical protein
LALFLAHVLPPDNPNEKTNRAILDLLRTLLPWEVRDLREFKLTEPLPQSWSYVLTICSSLILKKVARVSNIQGLQGMIEERDPIQCLSSVFDVLRAFPGVTIPKIIPNELGTFCYQNDLWIGTQIPDYLKEIQRELSEGRQDVRVKLLHPKFIAQFQTLRELELSTVCRDVEILVRQIFESSSRKEAKFRKPVSILYQRLTASPHTLSPFFPYLVKEQSSIVYEMVLEEDKRAALLAIAGLPVPTLMGIANRMNESEPGTESPELEAQLVEIGMRGEAAVYKDLKRRCPNLQIRWFNQSTPNVGFRVKGASNTIDLQVTTQDGKTISIEVKSTSRPRHAERMNLYVSGSQLDMFDKAGPQSPMIMATVHNALGRPQISYFSLESSKLESLLRT